VSSVAHRQVIVPEPEQSSSSTTSLSILNAFELRCDGQRISLPMSAQRLLVFVALQGRPLLRAYVAGTLWIDASEERAGASLRSSLWRLGRPGQQLIEATNSHLRLSPGIDLDLRRACDLAYRLLDRTSSSEDLDVAETTLGGELLPDWYDDWLLFERERFRQLGLHALEALTEQLAAAGRVGRALEAALSVVRSEPLRESAHRALIRVHLAEGNRGEALRQYERCRQLLWDQLGVEPSPQLEALLER
jgi:DNA-binding SARP family transcriptional activator